MHTMRNAEKGAVGNAVRFLILLLLNLGICFGRTLAGETYRLTTELPFKLSAFDSASPAKSHPHLFVSPAEIVSAKERIATDAVAEAIASRALAEADEQLSVDPKPVDGSWWHKAKEKPWAETYPEVYENTNIKPAKLARAARALAIAWLLTNKAEYARKAADFMMCLASFSFEPLHYDVGLNYAVWGIQFLEAYDILWPALTADERSQIDDCFTRMAIAIACNHVYWVENNIGGGINNHLAWHNAMLGLLGLFYDNPDMVDYCMNSRRGFLELLADGLVDDGLWCESSLLYQFAAVAPMLMFADCQIRVGHRPALSEITAPNGRTLKQAYDSMFNVLAPNLLVPPIGDSYGRRQKLADIELYEYAWSIWGDLNYAWLLNHGERRSTLSLFRKEVTVNAPAPPIASRLFPEHGYVFLRSHEDTGYWNNPDAICAFLTYDRSGVHSNADKLSLMLFGRNRMLLTDAESIATVPHAFSSRVQNELNRSTLSHNTIMIDGRDQKWVPDLLRLVEYRVLPQEKRVTAADPGGLLYDGVRQMRTVVLTPDYVLDVFQVDCGNRARQIDWIAHIMDENAVASPTKNPILANCQPFELPNQGAWRWLRNPMSTEIHGTINLEWHNATDRLRLTMLNSEGTRLITCGYPATDQPNSANMPMIIIRRNTTATVFAALWVIGDRVSDATLKQLADHDGKLVFQVCSDNIVRKHLVPRLPQKVE